MKKYTLVDYEREENMSIDKIIYNLKYLKRGYLADYDFTCDETDFERYKMHMAINNAIDHLEELSFKDQPKSKWIAFYKEKPKKNGYYLCYHMTSKCGNNEQWRLQTLYWEDNVWLYSHDLFKVVDNVSHWMIPPAPPVNNSKVEVRV